MKKVFVTGGTGSFGQEFAQEALRKTPWEITIYSRHEQLQAEMQKSLFDPRKKVKYLIGDVRDKHRLNFVLADMDYVVHAAALKNLDVTEYNPSETVKTNINGAVNIIDAAIMNNIEKVLVLSTDKSVSPMNLYGATKLCSDKLFIASNIHLKTKFSVIRYGNFTESRGSVVPLFKKMKKQKTKELPITDFKMTRFFINIGDAVALAREALEKMEGGEIFSPKMSGYLIADLAKKIYPRAKLVEIGRRPGEKLHENLILNDDATRTWEYDRYYITYPEFDWWNGKVVGGGKKLKEPVFFQYKSDLCQDEESKRMTKIRLD